VIALAAAAADSGTAELAARLRELAPVVLLAAEHAGMPDGVAWVKADLGAAEQAEAAWAAAEAAHGPAGLLVSLPAPLPSRRTPVVEIDDGGWAGAVRDHLLVAANVARAAARSMTAAGHGRIAMVTWRLDGAAGLVPVAAACGAVRQLARALAAEVGEHGVTVNAIPVPPGRLPDAAPAVRLLCSPDSGYLTAEALWPTGAEAASP
jgi:NAD(P)-dependent dehydrogenase (short-subunit alcohol dehydrogenase family)